MELPTIQETRKLLNEQDRELSRFIERVYENFDAKYELSPHHLSQALKFAAVNVRVMIDSGQWELAMQVADSFHYMIHANFKPKHPIPGVDNLVGRAQPNER